MAPNPKPTSVYYWAGGASPVDVVNPGSGKISEGWLKGEYPPHTVFNFLFLEAAMWHGYLQTIDQNAFTWTALQTFSAGVATTTLTATGKISTNSAAGIEATTGPVAGNTVTAAGLIRSTGGQVRGVTVLSDGPVTATTDFQYTASQTRFAYCPATELVATGVANQGRLASDDSPLGWWGGSSVTNYYVAGRAMIPVGATITGMQVATLSADGSDRTVRLSASYFAANGNAAMTATVLCSNANVVVPSDNTFAWRDATLGAGPFTMPSNGFLSFGIAIPQVVTTNNLRIYGVRFAYTMQNLRVVT